MCRRGWGAGSDEAVPGTWRSSDTGAGGSSHAWNALLHVSGQVHVLHAVSPTCPGVMPTAGHFFFSSGSAMTASKDARALR